MAAEQNMIEPFEPGQVKEVDGRRIVSYGTSSYGYDIRCADEFKLFTNLNSTIVDPKEFDEKNFVNVKGEFVVIPPNSFALARTIEYFRIPRNVLTICLGKSTYARCGILVNVTPFEPEWEGYVTLGVFEYHATPSQNLRQRRCGAGCVLRVRRSLRNFLQRQRRQVSRAGWRDSAQALSLSSKSKCRFPETTSAEGFEGSRYPGRAGAKNPSVSGRLHAAALTQTPSWMFCVNSSLSVSLSHGPNRCWYSVEVIKALTISAVRKSPLN